MELRLVSADSHVVESPLIYSHYLDRRLRSTAPRLIRDGSGGDQFLIPGMPRVLPLGLMASAGRPDGAVRETGISYSDIRVGAWDPGERLIDQDSDGVSAEVLYPSVGLVLLTHINREYAAGCLNAYNRWLADFVSAAPHRLIGCGVSAAASSSDVADDLRSIRRAGLRGVLLPLDPANGTYADDEYDVVWATAVEMDLPISFHAQPPRRRPGVMCDAGVVMSPIWQVQELLLDLLFGGVFARFPELRIVIAEFDSDWVKHFAARIDHQFIRHRAWLDLGAALSERPSYYLRRSVFFTAQDELVGAAAAGTSFQRVWASDFPHSESTYPNSRTAAARVANAFPREAMEILSGRSGSLYGISCEI